MTATIVSAAARSAIERLFPGGPRTLWQPIVEAAARERVHGREALLRGPRGLPYESPPMAFALAQSMGALVELDRVAVRTALRRHTRGRLFLNVHPATVLATAADWLREEALAAGHEPADVVVEVVEHDVTGGEALTTALKAVRAHGFALAVDDLGEGASGLRRVLEVRPEYAKIDRWVVDGAAGDAARRAVLRAIGQLGHDLGVKVIAEGVEREEDLAVVRESGIPYAQGFLLGRPAEDAEDILAEPAELPRPVLQQIDHLPPAELDALPFGVVQLAADGTVLQFNQYEENLSNRRAPQVIGRNFFTEVAPCTDVQEFAGRFRDGVARRQLDVSFDYRFRFAHGLRRVRVTLYASAATGTYWVFVQDRGPLVGGEPDAPAAG